jgi:hypothetical protein
VKGLVCALCLFDPDQPLNSKARKAITVMDGWAVCEDHMASWSGAAAQLATGRGWAL